MSNSWLNGSEGTPVTRCLITFITLSDFENFEMTFLFKCNFFWPEIEQYIKSIKWTLPLNLNFHVTKNYEGAIDLPSYDF